MRLVCIHLPSHDLRHTCCNDRVLHPLYPRLLYAKLSSVLCKRLPPPLRPARQRCFWCPNSSQGWRSGSLQWLPAVYASSARLLEGGHGRGPLHRRWLPCIILQPTRVDFPHCQSWRRCARPTGWYGCVVRGQPCGDDSAGHTARGPPFLPVKIAS